MSDEQQIMLGVEFLVSRMRSRRVYDARPGVGFRARLAQSELEYSMKTDEFEIPPMECRARRSRAVYIRMVPHAMRATSCRGGSKGLRPFRRGRWEEETAGVRART